ncbi:MAG TPA: inorganic phosphate transporter [Actinomycetota bacterium]|nr:inorganic phosphate transporter [Actinomycetota bacterium]
MSLAFVLSVGMALVFALTNGFHDAANAIATLVATRAARPLPAVLMASVFNLLGPLLLGAAVANTVAKIVEPPADLAIPVIGAALTGAVAWNVVTWLRGLPSSSSHALVGGLVGGAIVAAGVDAVNWGGIEDGRPVGVLGVLIALAISPALGVAVAAVLELGVRRALRRAAYAIGVPVRRAQWVTSAWLAFSHGSNDAQKTVGVVAALLLANGSTDSLSAPVWVELASALALTVGTAFGGWSIVRTIGRRIYRLRRLDGLVAQTSSAAVIVGASLLGAPVSTTQVVSSAVVGTGVGRRRARRVRWQVVRGIGVAWITTMPAAGALAAAAYPIWRWLA